MQSKIGGVRRAGRRPRRRNRPGAEGGAVMRRRANKKPAPGSGAGGGEGGCSAELCGGNPRPGIGAARGGGERFAGGERTSRLQGGCLGPGASRVMGVERCSGTVRPSDPGGHPAPLGQTRASSQFQPHSSSRGCRLRQARWEFARGVPNPECERIRSCNVFFFSNLRILRDYRGRAVSSAAGGNSYKLQTERGKTHHFRCLQTPGRASLAASRPLSAYRRMSVACPAGAVPASGAPAAGHETHIKHRSGVAIYLRACTLCCRCATAPL